MNGGKILTIPIAAMVAVFCIALMGVGIAYTASTENSSNSLSSEYVVLEQTNYNFVTADSFGYDTIVTKYRGFSFEVTSSEGTDAVISIGITDAELAAGERIKVWIVSENADPKEYASIDLTVREDTINPEYRSITVAVSGNTAGNINPATEENTVITPYTFTITVTGMETLSGITVSMSRTAYMLNGTESIAISGGSYIGKLAGTDSLRATRTAGTDMVPVKISSTGFADLTGKRWMYVIKITYDADRNGDPASNDWDLNPQYAYSDSSGDWDYAANDCIELTPEKHYKTELFIAGPASGLYAVSPYIPCDSNGVLINNGTVQFMFDSNYGPEAEP